VVTNGKLLGGAIRSFIEEKQAVHDFTLSGEPGRNLLLVATKTKQSVRNLTPILRSVLCVAAAVSVYIGLILLIRLSLPVLAQYLTRLKYGG
jgi:hypothetical protein